MGVVLIVNNIFPLNMMCQWVESGVPWSGLYYESVTTAWDNSCHGGEATIPYSKSYSYSTPSNKQMWTLFPDSFSVSVAAEFIGLTANWESETASMLTDTYSGSCNTSGCCLPNLYIYNVYTYTQVFYKRQVYVGVP
jgi:hypothetical protein